MTERTWQYNTSPNGTKRKSMTHPATEVDKAANQKVQDFVDQEHIKGKTFPLIKKDAEAKQVRGSRCCGVVPLQWLSCSTTVAAWHSKQSWRY